MSDRHATVAAIGALGYGLPDHSRGKGFSMFTIFPLLTTSLLIYTLLIALPFDGAWYDTQLVTIQMISGDPWSITWGDLFLTVSMFFLFIEILRSTRTGTDSILNHVFSALLFIVALLMFVILDGYGNSVFFLYLLMTCLDFMAGFIVTTLAARRDFGVSGGLGSG
ncbi:MAG: hypothetical protein AAF788_03110 [Pseudomonadota bacterium]